MPQSSGTVIFVNDVDKNLEYFTNTLGFRLVERWSTPDGATMHGSVAFGTGPTESRIDIAGVRGVTEMPSEAGAGEAYDFGQFGENIKNSPHTLGNGVILFFRVANVDKFYAKIQANGAIIDEPPTDQMWGQRTISVLTPDNYYMTFFQPIKGWKPGPEMTVTKPKLTTKQVNQRKYAGKMTHIRRRAADTKRGKGRIAKRSAATKARRNLGIGR